jgi:hypothetical protein
MTVTRSDLANAIRVLSMDAIEKAKSGTICATIPPIPPGPTATVSCFPMVMVPCFSTRCCTLRATTLASTT